MIRVLVAAGFCLFLLTSALPVAYGLSSCKLEYPAKVVAFSPGTRVDGSSLTEVQSDPSTLLGVPNGAKSVALGVGGSVTFSFTVPIAQYPAAGALTVRRPVGAPSCANHPVKATVSGSIDGITFVPLGTVCSDTSFDLGQFSWISFLRITDVTDASDAAFKGRIVDGFDVGAISGPGCLKAESCGRTARPDAQVSTSSDLVGLSIERIATDLILSKDTRFEEYGNGSARLVGTAYGAKSPALEFQITLSMTGRVTAPPVGSPLRLLKDSAYVELGGSVDPSTWYYYRSVSGSLFQIGGGASTPFVVSRSGPAVQVGEGCNGANSSPGLAASLAVFGAGTFGSRAMVLPMDLFPCKTTEDTEPLPPIATPIATPDPAEDDSGNVDSPGPKLPDQPTGSCSSVELSPVLAQIDGSMFDRRGGVGKATRLVMREGASKRARAFRRKSMEVTNSLYAIGWGDVWGYPQRVLTCQDTVRCVPVNFDAQRERLTTSAKALEDEVFQILRRAERLIRTSASKRLLARLVRDHAKNRAALTNEIGSLPTQSLVCDARSLQPQGQNEEGQNEEGQAEEGQGEEQGPEDASEDPDSFGNDGGK